MILCDNTVFEVFARVASNKEALYYNTKDLKINIPIADCLQLICYR